MSNFKTMKKLNHSTYIKPFVTIVSTHCSTPHHIEANWRRRKNKIKNKNKKCFACPSFYYSDLSLYIAIPVNFKLHDAPESAICSFHHCVE